MENRRRATTRSRITRVFSCAPLLAVLWTAPPELVGCGADRSSQSTGGAPDGSPAVSSGAGMTPGTSSATPIGGGGAATPGGTDGGVADTVGGDVTDGSPLDASAGDPNGGSAPAWPAYETVSDEHMTLVDPPTAGSNLSKSDCDFWDTYNSTQGP